MSETEEESVGHFAYGANALLVSGMIALCMFANLILTKFQIHWLPESGFAMIVGFLIGGVLNLVGSSKEEQMILFDPQFFFFILLPPIILDAGFSLKKKQFFQNVGTILLFAVVGTLISTVVVGYGVFGFADIIDVPMITSLECLIFGALISATDPVATLAILGSKHVNADELLYSLVFGESVLNDAVSIVLFNTFQGFVGESSTFTSETMWVVFGKFIGISIGSVAIGLSVGLLSAVMFRRLSFKGHQHYEFLLVYFFAYAAYCLAEIASFSGIMAIFFCGILMGHYTWYNLDSDSKKTTTLSLKGMSMVCETFLFVYLGITGVLYLRSDFALDWNGWLILVALVLCAVARCFQILLLGSCANLARTKKIPKKMLFVMVFSGLRGAIAFALALNATTPNRSLIVTTTMTIVIVTNLGCGLLTLPILKRFGMVRPSASIEPMLLSRAEADANGSSSEALPEMQVGWHQKLVALDQKLMQPFFGGPTCPKKDKRRQPRGLADAFLAGDQHASHDGFKSPQARELLEMQTEPMSPIETKSESEDFLSSTSSHVRLEES